MLEKNSIWRYSDRFIENMENTPHFLDRWLRENTPDIGDKVKIIGTLNLGYVFFCFIDDKYADNLLIVRDVYFLKSFSPIKPNIKVL